MIFATIAERDIANLANGSLLVNFIKEANESELDWDESYTMVESEAFFEACHHVLKALQGRLYSVYFKAEKYTVILEKVYCSLLLIPI